MSRGDLVHALCWMSFHLILILTKNLLGMNFQVNGPLVAHFLISKSYNYNLL